jgi:hypothetical protein
MGYIYDRESRSWTFMGTKELYDEFQKAIKEYWEYLKEQSNEQTRKTHDREKDSRKT